MLLIYLIVTSVLVLRPRGLFGGAAAGRGAAPGGDPGGGRGARGAGGDAGGRPLRALREDLLRHAHARLRHALLHVPPEVLPADGRRRGHARAPPVPAG